MAYALPKLDYAYDALEPHIDARTMEIHHSKHHQTYVDKVNGLLKGTQLEKLTIEQVISDIDKVPENIRMGVRNHGGGHANHSFFWKVIGPKAGGEPKGKLADAIKARFQGFDRFKEEFGNAAMNRFGSGWAWLILDKGKLAITSTANQDSPLSEGKTPLLTLDIWEHAYYLKYQNRRADYVGAFWNVVNWKEVQRRFEEGLG